jgi:hypothetical protein
VFEALTEGGVHGTGDECHDDAPHDQTHSVLPAREITEIALARHGRFTYDDQQRYGMPSGLQETDLAYRGQPCAQRIARLGRSFDNFLVDDGERNKDGDQSRRWSHV